MRRTILGILFSLVLATPAAAAHRPKVSVEDLTLLAKSDISDETILVFLDPREIGFELDPEAIAHLRQQGVSEEVIRYLLERTDARSERDRVVYVSAGPYPSRYYDLHYGHGVYPYFGAAHWTHGYHWVGHHLVARHHLGVSAGHSASHGSSHSASSGHLVGGHHARGHSSGAHVALSHPRSHGASHARAGHSGGGRSSGHSRGLHGGGHGGGGH